MNNNYNNNNNPYGAPPQMPGFQQPPYGAPQTPGYQQPPYGAYGAPSTQPMQYPAQPQSMNYPPQGNYPQQPFHAAPNQPTLVGPPQHGYPVQHQSSPLQQPGYPQTGYAPTQNPSSYPNHNQMPYQNQPAYPQAPNYNNQSNNRWDERVYLKQIFDELDHNRDGEISGQELHEALRRGQTNYEFDPFTVSFLLEKYDGNRDNEISFAEFHDLYVGLNVQFNEFLDIDQDSSGFIDGRELANALRRKGYNFSQEIFDYVVNEIARRSGKQGISFDTYVRVIARFDLLRDQYNRNPYKTGPLEKHIREHYF